MSEHDVAIRAILEALLDKFDSDTLRTIESACYTALSDYEINKIEISTTELSADVSPDLRAYQMFFVAKKVEGLSEKSLKLYSYTYKKFFAMIQKPFATITANDIRIYIASRQGVTPTTVNNERLHLSSLFSWLCNEEYIPKNPMLKIKQIRMARVVRKPYSGKEIEELRDACRNKRDRAIIEILLSTGMRVGELHGVNREDISGSEVLVTGKGNKQRICYLNPTAVKRLHDYLEERMDKDVPLIRAVNQGARRAKDNRVGISGLELIVRELGRRAGVTNVHPHRFRRTAATTALQRGMPIEQVQMMLGHANIQTTLGYAITADDSVKHSHRKYM